VFVISKELLGSGTGYDLVRRGVTGTASDNANRWHDFDPTRHLGAPPRAPGGVPRRRRMGIAGFDARELQRRTPSPTRRGSANSGT